MAVSKEVYSISATDITQLRDDLNFILQRIADRLDKAEGLRGNAVIKDQLDITVDDGENIVHGFNVDD